MSDDIFDAIRKKDINYITDYISSRKIDDITDKTSEGIYL